MMEKFIVKKQYLCKSCGEPVMATFTTDRESLILMCDTAGCPRVGTLYETATEIINADETA